MRVVYIFLLFLFVHSTTNFQFTSCVLGFRNINIQYSPRVEFSIYDNLPSLPKSQANPIISNYCNDEKLENKNLRKKETINDALGERNTKVDTSASKALINELKELSSKTIKEALCILSTYAFSDSINSKVLTKVTNLWNAQAKLDLLRRYDLFGGSGGAGLESEIYCELRSLHEAVHDINRFLNKRLKETEMQYQAEDVLDSALSRQRGNNPSVATLKRNQHN